MAHHLVMYDYPTGDPIWLISAIAAALAAEREAALRPVLALAEELDDPWGGRDADLAAAIRAACSGQGDGAEEMPIPGPQSPVSGLTGSNACTETPPRPQRGAEGE